MPPGDSQNSALDEEIDLAVGRMIVQAAHLETELKETVIALLGGTDVARVIAKDTTGMKSAELLGEMVPVSGLSGSEKERIIRTADQARVALSERNSIAHGERVLIAGSGDYLAVSRNKKKQCKSLAAHDIEELADSMHSLWTDLVQRGRAVAA